MFDTQKEGVKTYFDRNAQDYERVYDNKDSDLVRAYIFSSRKKYVLNMFDLMGGRVLDIGCGPGVLTEELLMNNCEVWGVDISKAMIEQANKRMEEKRIKENFHFSVGDIEKLDFPAKYFDFVFCVGVLEYLRDGSKALKEIQRVLRNKGQVIITVPNMSSPFVLFDKIALIIVRFSLKIFNYILSFFKTKIRMPPDRLSFRTDAINKYYLPWKLNKELIKNGFEINKMVFHIFRLTILNSISPKLSLFWAKKLDFLTRSPIRWWGINYIVKASKI